MFGRIKFRVISQHSKSSAENISDLVRKEGFKVYDLLESDIVLSSDSSKIQSVYVLCCKGDEGDFELFKHKHQFTEIKYEGFRTLI